MGFPTWKRWWGNKTVSRETHELVEKVWTDWTRGLEQRLAS